ncbi:signal peptidase I [Nesterenkonia natronophila]|uniref:Signal peptidase I n=1 Tax=Nesterenkonia natronophila TaxID=2174932 RepID=A0A3A4EZM3_9MICC|nr:signal peptidase I [Nesterenkonia natronophila]RJN31086.1 signal peptidase I [Nesterenkonia natronophila]
MPESPETSEPCSESRGSRPLTLRRRWVYGAGVVVIVALILSTLTRVFAVDFYAVDQDSMDPTLSDGERIAVAKSYPDEAGVQRGDIVVFDGEGSFTPYRGGPSLTRSIETMGHWIGLGSAPHVYVKRVLGAEGDLVACCDDSGELTVNGEPIAEPYLSHEVSPEKPASELSFEAAIPEGRFWVMGDNRDASVDSRDLLGAPGGGMISEERIIGLATSVVWPWEDRRALEGGLR